MTRYLESWGAAKPFANLHHRDCMTADNGKIKTTVSTHARARAPSRGQGSAAERCDAISRTSRWASITSTGERGERERERELGRRWFSVFA